MQISCRHYLKFYFFSYLSNLLYYLRDQGVYTHVFSNFLYYQIMATANLHINGFYAKCSKVTGRHSP